MSSDAQHLQALSSVPQLSSLYATYGVEVNALSVDQVFALSYIPLRPLASVRTSTS